MFEHEQALGLEQAALQHQVGEFFQPWKGIGRIGKDEVELFMAVGQIAEHVCPQGETVGFPQLL